MNREQAINYLISRGFTHEQVGEVVRALTYEPTTKNDLGVDCISRQAVIDGIKEYFHDEYYQRTSIQDCRDCFIEDVLNNLPSVTPQLSSELEKNSKKLEKGTTKNDLGVDEVTALAEWTEKLTKECEEAYKKGYEAGRKELEPITSKDKFIYALTACGCLLKDGKTWYERNELIECFENLGLLENPHTKNKESMTTKQKYLMACDYAIRQLIKTGSSQLSIIKGNEWIDVPFAEVLNWLEEEYKQTNADRSVEE